MAQSTELIPPSDEDSEDQDIFQSLLHNNINLTHVPASEYDNFPNNAQNAVYTNLRSFQPHLTSCEYIFSIHISFYISLLFSKTHKI